jgi:RHS repeat-associated protein
VWQWENSDPFGDNLPQEDPGSTGNRLEFNLRFPGQYYDRESGLYYNYHRTYDPSVGRYVESDPIGLAGGINLYAYVGGNPIGYVDYLGLAGDKPWGGWGDINSRPWPTDQSGRTHKGAASIEGPYKAPERTSDKIADRILDRLVKEVTGLGGFITKSPLGVAISGLTYSTGLNINEVEELMKIDLERFCRWNKIRVKVWDLNNHGRLNKGHILVKELIGLPTYFAGGAVASSNSSSAFGFFGLMALLVIFYNLIYLQFFPKFDVQNKKFNLVTFFFAQVAFWGGLLVLL